MPLLQRKRYLNLNHAGLYVPVFTPTSTESSDFLARTSGMNDAHKIATDAFITGLVTDSLWSTFDALYLLAQDTAGNAALNLKSSSFTLTVNGSPTFTADSGYVGGSTANLDTGFNPATAGGNLAQNSSSAFIWTLTNLTAGVSYGAALGQNIASITIGIFPHFTDNKFYGQMTSTSGFTPPTATGHFYGASRTASTTTDIYVDTGKTTSAQASTALTSTNIILLNDSVGNTRPLTANLAFACFGSSLNATQQGNLYARVHTYMQTIAGAP